MKIKKNFFVLLLKGIDFWMIYSIFNILRVVVCYKFYYFENGIRNENMYKSKVILSKIILGISKEKIMIF